MSENKNVNAAFRLHALLKAAVAVQAPNNTQFQVWVAVLQLQNLTPRMQKRIVGRAIELILQQLDRVVEQLEALNHSPDSYEELVSVLESVISFEWINGQWREIRERIEKYLYPLVIISNLLPNEEVQIDPKEFEAIWAELDNLEQSLVDKEISPLVRNFVKKQIEMIRRAIWEYRFRGASAFQSAMMDLYREYSSSNVAVEHANDPPIQKVAHIWKKVKTLMDATIKIQGALTAGQKIYELAKHAGLHHL